MGYFQSFEVLSEDLDIAIDIVDETVYGGVEEISQRGQYYEVEVYLRDDNESDRLENELDNYGFEWSWL